MSAPTFETLSAELTQALSERRDIPPQTTARCTLGRDKVMVLVEYPSRRADDGKKLATRTLDWLEQRLRLQFDMTGLPVELADLSETAEEVAVQLYLKHMSASKPFTMRSFTWKVEDGFADLFDQPTSERSESSQPESSQVDSSFSSELYSEKVLDLVSDSEEPTGFSADSTTDLDADLSEGISQTAQRSDDDLLEFLVPDRASVIASSELDLPTIDLPAAGNSSDDRSLDFFDLETEEPTVETGPETLDLTLSVEPDDIVTDEELADEELTDEELAAEALFEEESFIEDSFVDSEFAVNNLVTDDLATDLATNEATKDIRDDSIEALEVENSVETAVFVEEYVEDSLFFDRSVAELALEESGSEAPTFEDLGFEELGSEGLGSEESGSEELTSEELESEELTFEDLESENLEFENLESENLESEGLESELTSELASEELAPENLESEELASESLTIEESALQDLPSEGLSPDLAPDGLVAEASVSEAPKTEAPKIEDLAFGSIVPKDPTLGEAEAEDLAPKNLGIEGLEIEDLTLKAPALEELDLDKLDLDESVSRKADLEQLTQAEAVQAEAVKEAAVSEEAAFAESQEPEAREFLLEDLVPEELASGELTVKETPVVEAAPDEIETSETDSSVVNEQLADEQPIPFEYDEAEALPNVYAVLADSETAYTDDDYTTEAYSDDDENEDYEGDYKDEDYLDEGSAYFLAGDRTQSAPQTEEDIAPVEEEEVQWQREQWTQQSKTSPWIFVGLFGFLVAGVLGFVLTRPCTVGQCDRLETARIESEEALDQLRTDDSAEAIEASQQKLRRSIRRLRPIPVWSSYRDEAQAAIPGYERQLNALDLVSEAQSKAYSAAVQSQDPPHSVETWKEIAAQWREATAALSAVPNDSPVYELAQTKLAEYRANLSTILVRVETESRAEVSLRQAQQSASQATQQAETAASVEAWEAAVATWETALENLRQIPQGTQAYAEAQQMLPEYEQKLKEVQDRAKTERSASDRLSEAKQNAAAAQRAESESLWTLAIEKWNSALLDLESVDKDTSAHSEVGILLPQYTKSWNEAGKNQETSFRFQTVEPNFFLVCGVSTVQVCTYAIKAGSVRVDLFDGYDEVIDQSITPPDQRVQTVANEQLVARSNQLLQQITQLSQQAQIPLVLHDSKGQFLARYRPELDGFVRQ